MMKKRGFSKKINYSAFDTLFEKSSRNASREQSVVSGPREGSVAVETESVAPPETDLGADEDEDEEVDDGSDVASAVGSNTGSAAGWDF